MKVKNFINMLNDIGYDDNTELTFSTVSYYGEYLDLPFEEITYGEELTGKPYSKDVIDVGVNLDSSSDFMAHLSERIIGDFKERILNM